MPALRKTQKSTRIHESTHRQKNTLLKQIRENILAVPLLFTVLSIAVILILDKMSGSSLLNPFIFLVFIASALYIGVVLRGKRKSIWDVATISSAYGVFAAIVYMAYWYIHSILLPVIIDVTYPSGLKVWQQQMPNFFQIGPIYLAIVFAVSLVVVARIGYMVRDIFS